MKDGYQRQVSLLLDVLPIVARAKVFALKGGTAINFFFNDCPRLSVDIDLHYLPSHNRNDALQDIRANMEAIKSEVEKSLSGVRMTIDPMTFNAQVQSEKALIKIEPNTVIRGTLLEPVEMPLCSYLEQEYSRGMSVPCVAKAELYAGKLCAALQRQHPRDLFDTLLFLEQGEGLNRDAVDAFLIYLISQGKPIHEMLAPNIHDIEHLYNGQFLGMTKIEVNLNQLREVQSSLSRKITTALKEQDRDFLIGFKQGEPDWDLLPFPNVRDLPAVRWKQLNLNKMNGKKRGQAVQNLIQVFKNNPYQQIDAQEAAMSAPAKPDQKEKLKPQAQLAEQIINELVSKNLIDEGRRKQLRQQMAVGSLKPEDWSLIIDIATVQDGRSDQGENDDG